MKVNRILIIVGLICLVAAVWLVSSKRGADNVEARAGSVDENRHSTGHVPGLKHQAGAVDRKPVDVAPPKPLRMEPLPLVEDRAVVSVHRALGDDEILAKGRVAARPKEVSPQPPQVSKEKCLHSIQAGDWKNNANALVLALRAGQGFEIAQDQVMAFLNGKDLLGWPECYRNWIGDELMTALRQDTPQTAFRDLKSIQENREAPAAMRDYAVQHISHLVTAGVIGSEGTDYIWKVLSQNDPVTAGTALISLQRISEQMPELVSGRDVVAAAGKFLDTKDERLLATARSIAVKK
jgi:hypothetical protein